MTFDLRASHHFASEDYAKRMEELGFRYEFSGAFADKPYRKVKEGDPVTFNTLDELMAFVDKYGEIVLCDLSIEIYDTYRE